MRMRQEECRRGQKRVASDCVRETRLGQRQVASEEPEWIGEIGEWEWHECKCRCVGGSAEGGRSGSCQKSQNGLVGFGSENGTTASADALVHRKEVGSARNAKGSGTLPRSEYDVHAGLPMVEDMSMGASVGRTGASGSAEEDRGGSCQRRQNGLMGLGSGNDASAMGSTQHDNVQHDNP